MGRGQEVIIESQNQEGGREQALPKTAKPGAEHDRAQKQRYERRGLPIVLQQRCEYDRDGNQKERDRIPPNNRRVGPPQSFGLPHTLPRQSNGSPGVHTIICLVSRLLILLLFLEVWPH